MAPEAVAWWQDTLRKGLRDREWPGYIKVNLLAPTAWTGEKASKYPTASPQRERRSPISVA
jgi:tripartite-type tricarboxylate transporter receptor subunit TctC